MKKTLLGLAVASALGTATLANALPGVKFDETGTSSAGVVVNQFVWNVDNGLLFGAAGGGVGKLVAVAKLDTASGTGGTVVPDAGNAFTYELSIPLTVLDLGVALSLNFDATRPLLSFFRIYHTTNTVDQAAGTGYGFGSGSVAANTTLILEGTANFAGNNMVLTYGNDDFGNMNRLRPGDAIGNNIATLTYSGSKSINIEITSQDSAYFRTDMEALLFDMRLVNQAWNAPFPTSPTLPVVGAKVLGETPDLGDSAVTPVFNSETGAADGSTTGPVNNNNCDGGKGRDGSALTPGDCDVRLSTGQGNLQVLSEIVPEPSTVALIGLGLGALGMAGFRRRRQAS